jgi:hypothetical protein
LILLRDSILEIAPSLSPVLAATGDLQPTSLHSPSPPLSDPLDPINNHGFGHTIATNQHRPEFKRLPYVTLGGEDIASRVSRRRLWYYEYTMFTALRLMMRVNTEDLMTNLTTGRAKEEVGGKRLRSKDVLMRCNSVRTSYFAVPCY